MMEIHCSPKPSFSMEFYFVLVAVMSLNVQIFFEPQAPIVRYRG